MRKIPVTDSERKLGSIVGICRESLGISQTRFALDLQIGRERLAKYENGAVPMPTRFLPAIRSVLEKKQAIIRDTLALLNLQKGGAS